MFFDSFFDSKEDRRRTIGALSKGVGIASDIANAREGRFDRNGYTARNIDRAAKKYIGDPLDRATMRGIDKFMDIFDK